MRHGRQPGLLLPGEGAVVVVVFGGCGGPSEGDGEGSRGAGLSPGGGPLGALGGLTEKRLHVRGPRQAGARPGAPSVPLLPRHGRA